MVKAAEYAEPVGVTKGPGETPHEYLFISTDEHHRLKTGEYVWYHLHAGNEQHQVFGRIIERRAVQLFPDSFLSDPTIAPVDIAAVIGFSRERSDLFEMAVSIMGYYDFSRGAFINPWIPPQSGMPIYLASNEQLTLVLSKQQLGAIGSAHIGDLLTREPQDVPIIIDLKEVASTHLAIIASTGAGKSYLAGVLIEEFMRSYNKAAILIIDPHGEYGTLQDMADSDAFVETNEHGHLVYRPTVKVFAHDSVKVKISTLRLSDITYLLHELTEKQHHLLALGMRKLSQDKRHNWNAHDLVEAIRESGSTERDDSSTIGALDWKIQSRFSEDNFVFSDHEHSNLSELFEPGTCSVLQLNEIDEKDQQIIVATILRRLYKARMDSERKKVRDGEYFLPYPVFVLLEEAHHFAPAGEAIITTEILKRILAEGRKFGIGVGLISQRPGKLDADVLSQCQTQCIMRIVNEVDQKAVATAVESVGHELLDNLPALTKGQVIISGSAVNTPVLCRVRARLTRHGGESHDAPARWQSYFSDDEILSRQQNTAFAAPPTTSMPFLKSTRPTRRGS